MKEKKHLSIRQFREQEKQKLRDLFDKAHGPNERARINSEMQRRKLPPGKQPGQTSSYDKDE